MESQANIPVSDFLSQNQALWCILGEKHSIDADDD
jgi:hypothetical protein